MSLRRFIVPLLFEGEHVRTTLVMEDDDKHGTIKLDGQVVCHFEIETAGAVSNYFTAEQVVREYIDQIFGTETEPVETGFTPVA